MMKKTLFALSLASSFLTAEEMTSQGPDYNSQGTDCYPCEPCGPCCEPKPKKCIDCECYSPPFYDLQCDWGMFATVDFLYWFAKETGLTYALKTESPDSKFSLGAQSGVLNQVAPRKYKSMDEEWDPGFRAGLGLNSDCDGWDLYAHWTYFHTCNKRSTSVKDTTFEFINFPLGKSLISPWFNPGNSAGKTLSPNSNDIHFFTKITAKWRINYNVLDLEIGRKYWLSQYMSMRPFMGIRGACTRIHFSTNPSSESVVDIKTVLLSNETSYKIRFKNRFWGVGLLGGFQPDWHFGCGFSLFGNVDIALLWGDFDIKRKENTSSFSTVLTEPIFALTAGDLGTSKNAFSAMQAILDLGVGLRWESNFCQDRYHLGIDLGWEHHIWFNHNHRFQLRGSFESDADVAPDRQGLSFQHFDETYGNLVLGGPTARLRFDF